MADNAAQRPNILWYCTDQQRHDTIGALGNPHINTPQLDAFCETGVAFDNAYCQSPICTPSRASFLTGRYPATTHVHRNGNAYFPAGERLVTKIFSDAGYDCGLVGKLHLSSAKGYEKRTDDGYRLFQWSHHPHPDLDPAHHAYHQWLEKEKGVDAADLYSTVTGFYAEGVPAELHQTTWVTEAAIRFVEQKRSGPWLLSLNPFDPHPPFDPPPDYLARYAPGDLPPPLFRPSDLERQKAFRGIAQQTIDAMDPMGEMPTEKLSAEEARKTAYSPPKQFNGQVVKAAYYAMIELIDHEFGRLLRALDAMGELENTIVVFHSDHGEMLGDHGLLYKGCRFFEGLVHVPLIVSWPGHIQENVRSRALVELVDIAPTLLEATGLDVPGDMQGRSLWPLMTGTSDLNTHKPHVVSEFNDALGSAAISAPSHGTMYFDGRMKHIVYHGTDLGELYDLKVDPGEFENLFDEPAVQEQRLELMRRHFDALMATSSPGIERTSIY
ncbi:MAG: sulfatase-like hydrolase/transferase [Pseudomonadota bacterium]